MILVIWDLEEEPQGNIQHIAEHDVTPEEVEEVLNDRHSRDDLQCFERPANYVWMDGGGAIPSRSVGVGRRRAVDGLSGYRLSCPGTSMGD